MSRTADHDLAAELEAPETGRNGTPVDARCCSCKRVRAKFASKIRGSPGSFQYVCHVCCRVTWWNIGTQGGTGVIDLSRNLSRTGERRCGYRLRSIH